jgi:hypothetical protein
VGSGDNSTTQVVATASTNFNSSAAAAAATSTQVATAASNFDSIASATNTTSTPTPTGAPTAAVKEADAVVDASLPTGGWSSSMTDIPSSAPTEDLSSIPGVVVSYSIDFTDIWEEEQSSLKASMNPKSAADAAAYGVMLADQLTAVDIPTSYIDLTTSSWTKWEPPDDGTGPAKLRRKRLVETEVSDGQPSSTKLGLLSFFGILLLKTTHDKVKVCLENERRRQVRKRKHEERAIRMGWKKPEEQLPEQAKDAVDYY